MNKYKAIKEKQLAKRVIKNSDRSSCCNTQLKSSKSGRVMCLSCNRFCKIVPGKNKPKNNYIVSIVMVILSTLALIALSIVSVINK